MLEGPKPLSPYFVQSIDIDQVSEPGVREGGVLAAHTCEGLAVHRSGRSKMGTMTKETVLDSQGCQPHTGRHGAQLS